MMLKNYEVLRMPTPKKSTTSKNSSLVLMYKAGQHFGHQEFQNVVQAKAFQGRLNDWFGRNYVETKFIYFDGSED